MLLKLDHTRIADTMSGHGIEFRFNLPAASYFGGVFEHLVRTVKTTLYTVLSRFSDTCHEDIFLTALVEVESIVNSRLLTPFSDDYNALTPNHSISGRADPQLPPNVASLDPRTYGRRWRIAQQISENAWTRFRQEYLPELTELHK